MTQPDMIAMTAGRKKIALEDGLELRLLSAYEVLEAGREAELLAAQERERALCSNACLLARALEKRGRPVFEDGGQVLKTLSPGQILELTERWAAFDRAENPAATDEEGRVNALKKAWSTRLMSALSGVCFKALGRFQPRNGQEK